MVDSRPMKRLNYEINERLLAPFKQREQYSSNGGQVNWLEKPILASVSGVNRYSHQPPYRTTSTTSSVGSGGYRKKVIRKKKVSRPSTGMAVSSSTNLYGHSSTQLLTGALTVTKSGQRQKNSRDRSTSHHHVPPKILQHHQNIIASPLPTYTPEHNNAGHNIELSGWKPVTPPPSVFSTISTTPSPLFSYHETSEAHHKLTSPVEYYLPTTTSQAQPKTTTRPHNVEFNPKTVSFDLKDALKATYETLANTEKPVVPSSNSGHRVHKQKPQHDIFISSASPYRVSYTTPRPTPRKKQNQQQQSSTNTANYNRYVVIPQNNQSAITVMFEYQNVSTPAVSERSRFGLGDALVKNSVLIDSSNTGRNKFSHDISRIVTTTEFPLPPKPSQPNSSVPIRDTLEDFIKRTIDPKAGTSSVASDSHQPNYTQGRSFPSSSVSHNHIETHVITLDDVMARAPPIQRPPKVITLSNGQRRARKYRPLISLNQTTPAASVPPASPTPTTTTKAQPLFTSQRIGHSSSFNLATPASPLETYHYSDHNNHKSSINLNEPNTIYVYQSPKTNEVSEHTGKTVQPFFTTTNSAYDQSRVYNFGNPNTASVTQAPPAPLPTRPMTTSRAISEVEYAVDGVHDFVQTLPVTLPTTTKAPTTTRTSTQSRYRTSRTELPMTTPTTTTTTTSTTSTTSTTTSTTTTPAPVVVSTSDSYGYYEDYDKDYGDYVDSDYKLMGNKTNVLSQPSSTTSTTTTTTTTTTTPAPTIAPYNYRRLNVTR